MKVHVRCPGKVILFGEHASVYGQPSLVSTISAYTEVVIERLIDPVICYEAPGFDFKNDCKVSLLDDIVQITSEETELTACTQLKHVLEQKQSLTEDSWFLLLYLYHKIVEDKFGIRVTATTNLWPGAGMGSSASYCSSLALGLLTLCKGDTSTANVNRIAYLGEKIFHGRPSGVDNTACTYGGCFVYCKKENGDSSFDRIDLKHVPKLIIINSKHSRRTADIVAQVAKQRQNLQETFERIGEISLNGRDCLVNGRDIGDLFTDNHNLLNKLPGVSHTKTDKIIEICNDYGVPAKITGAGGGGVVIGLVRDGVNVEGLRKCMEKSGFGVMCDMKMGVRGVHVTSIS